ncbi:MAG: hypothetical protein IKP76_03585 [Bacilli bacterium]|nr:hypothetical protein [Bacilli bacterium]
MDYLDNIDYEFLLDFMIENYDGIGFDYEDVVYKPVQKKNMLDRGYQEFDDRILSNMAYLNNKKNTIKYNEQDDSHRTFRFIKLNLPDEKQDFKYRLYLCPQEQRLHELVNEIMTRGHEKDLPLYLKYSRENRYDKLIFYISTDEQYKTIISLLEEIKKAKPYLFEYMSKGPSFLFPSRFEGAYLTANKFPANYNGKKFSSYNKAFTNMLETIYNKMLYFYGVQNLKDVENIDMDVFKSKVKNAVMEYGFCYTQDKDGNMKRLVNDNYPGVDQPLRFILTKIDDYLVFGKLIGNSKYEFKVTKYEKGKYKYHPEYTFEEDYNNITHVLYNRQLFNNYIETNKK